VPKKMLRIQICNSVPADVKDKFQKAVSLDQSHTGEALRNRQPGFTVPVIPDESIYFQ
jgi:hypothetical protein